VVEQDVNLKPFNTFGLPAVARRLVRVREASDVRRVVDHPQLGLAPKFVLGGGSNLVLTRDLDAVVLKIEIPGLRLLESRADAWIVEAGAGVGWHALVAWTIEQGYPGLENMALIPGTVGAAPVQNIGAYGVELQDRFESLDAVDLRTGALFTLNAAQCAFGYRDSVFKHHSALGLKDSAAIVRVRFALPKVWKPVLGYADLEKKMALAGVAQPSAQQIFDWVCEVRRHKLPDPDVIGNAGSFFKNPTVSPEQCADIIAREPKVVHYRMDDGSVKLAAGWLIDACGWKGKSVGQAGVYERQALVLVNRGAGVNGEGATGGEVMTLAKAIQTSVYERFGLRLEPEPVVL
jgi:UDP-N-acetylmuramate dehydrogenase